jgi:hypothetical protein
MKSFLPLLTHLLRQEAFVRYTLISAKDGISNPFYKQTNAATDSPSIFLVMNSCFSKWKLEKIERQFRFMGGTGSAVPVYCTVSYAAA